MATRNLPVSRRPTPSLYKYRLQKHARLKKYTKSREDVLFNDVFSFSPGWKQAYNMASYSQHDMRSLQTPLPGF